ncbi:MAG: hypothetical protein ACKOOF_04755 [Planctomycetaceae bacterium]
MTNHDQPTASAAPGGGGRVLLEPWVLIYPPGGIGLIWSQKSACTTALLWYLAHLGLLEAAAAYSRWPHNYRMKVLPENESYKRWVAACDPNRLRWVRVIRDPCRRAVSSYRHALRFGYENDAIGRVLGLSVAERGFSFSEFLAYLDRIDVVSCNPHHSQQWHAFEAELPAARVVNADKEPLLDSLCDFADPGAGARELLAAEAARIAELHHARRMHSRGHCADVVFQPSNAGGEWPEYEAFLDSQGRSSIERIYRVDFEQFVGVL